MKREEVQRFLDLSCFSRGHFPVKFLGVPICFKRISSKECNNVIEKMIKIIRTWSSRHLSYKGILQQLINSVLVSIHVYWAKVFILLRNILKPVDSICRAFLWSGEFYSGKLGMWLGHKYGCLSYLKVWV